MGKSPILLSVCGLLVTLLLYRQVTEPGSLLKSHDLHEGLVQLKRFNARRKFRSVVNLLIAKAKFEKIVEAAKLMRLSIQHIPTPPAVYDSVRPVPPTPPLM
jgi:hypothetical protein